MTGAIDETCFSILASLSLFEKSQQQREGMEHENLR